MHCQWEENPKTAQKIGKDRACGYGDILTDRETGIQTYSL